MPRPLFWWRLALLALTFGLALTYDQGQAQEGPSVIITAPMEGEVLAGPNITVSVEVSGFTLRPPLTPAREPDAGQLIYFLDAEPSFDQPNPLGEDNVIPSGRLSETFARAAAGEHTIRVCLAYDDFTCIDPALTDSVRVKVGEPPPTATPSPEPTLWPTVESPPAPSPSPAPPPAETPALDEISVATATATPTPAKPSPTSPPPTATPAAGLAPGTAPRRADGDDFPWWYVAIGGWVGLMMAAAAGALWRGTRNRR